MFLYDTMHQDNCLRYVQGYLLWCPASKVDGCLQDSMQKTPQSAVPILLQRQGFPGYIQFRLLA